MNEVIIGKIKKNALEDIWVTLDEYHGHRLLNIRSYFHAADGPHPTRKGIAIETSKLPQLRDALHSQSANRCDGTQVMRIAKGKKVEIRIYASEYMGRQLMNIRVFYPTDDAAEKRPGRGIAFSVNLIDELIRILDVAARHLAAV
jgi:hypothetical protein